MLHLQCAPVKYLALTALFACSYCTPASKKALFEAVEINDIKKAKIFVHKIKEINAENHEAKTVLHIAAKHGNLNMIKLLTSKGASPYGISTYKTYVNPYIGTPLHIATENGFFNIVAYFIKDLKVDPNIDSLYIGTPLHQACKNGHFDIVKLLVKDGKAQKCFDNQYAKTPRKCALAKGHDDIAKYLES